MAAIAALHSGQHREGLHVVVQHCQQGFEVAVVERVKCPPGQVDVLLRHCPASIRRATGRVQVASSPWAIAGYGVGRQ
jgi:hypothetical protein